MIVLALLASVSVLVHANSLTDSIYTSLLNATTCHRLLDEFGEIGCSCSFVLARLWFVQLISPSAADIGGTVGVLYLIDTPSHLTAFANAPESAYIAIVAQSLFAEFVYQRTMRLLCSHANAATRH